MKKVRFHFDDDKDKISHENRIASTEQISHENHEASTNLKKESTKSRQQCFDTIENQTVAKKQKRKHQSNQNFISNDILNHNQDLRKFSAHNSGCFAKHGTAILTSSLKRKCVESFPIKRQNDIKYEAQSKNITQNHNEISIIDSPQIIVGLKEHRNPTVANYLHTNTKELDSTIKEKKKYYGVQSNERTSWMLKNKDMRNDSTLLTSKTENEKHLKNRNMKSISVKNKQEIYHGIQNQNKKSNAASNNNQYARHEADFVNVLMEHEVSSIANGLSYKSDNSDCMEDKKMKYHSVRSNNSSGNIANDNQNLRNDPADIDAQIERESSILANYLNQFDSLTMQEIERIKSKRMKK